MVKNNKNNHKKLKPVLSRNDVIWMVAAATLGGGLFTLFGPTMALAGPAIIIVIVANGLIELLTAIRYAQLSNVMPDVGGGQQWIRKGLGSYWGHMSGWVSWLAHSVACGVYAMSLGFYLTKFLFGYLFVKIGFIEPGNEEIWQKIFTVSTVIILSVINYFGVKFTGKLNKYGAIAAISILLVFIGFGILGISKNFESSIGNLNDFFAYGFAGILSGMGMFYLAYQGQEVGAQGGEEVKDPKKNLGQGIIIGYLIVFFLYILVATTVLLGVHGQFSSAKILADAKEGALLAASLNFIGSVFLFPAILIAGIIIAFIALNSTIYSSSHAFLALARNQSIPKILDRISPKYNTPSFGILISSALIVLMVIFLPLNDIAAVADVLFMFLFALLHFAFMDLKRRKQVLQKAKVYPIPFYPYSIGLVYAVLIIAMWHVSPFGVIFGLGWLFVGSLLYSRYTQIEEFREVDSSIAFSRFTRRGQFMDFKVHCAFLESSSATPEKNKMLIMEISEAIGRGIKKASEFVYYQEIPKEYKDISSEYQKAILQKAQEFFRPLEQELAQRQDTSYGLVSPVRIDMGEGITEMVKRENSDVLIISMENLRKLNPGFFMPLLQNVLREARCDLFIAEVGDNVSLPKKVLVPFTESPHNRLLAQTILSFMDAFGVVPTFMFVVEPQKKEAELKKIKKQLFSLGLSDAGELIIIKNNGAADVVEHILDMANDYDAILMTSAKGGSLKEIVLGRTAQAILEKTKKTTIVVHHHQEVFDPVITPFISLYDKIKGNLIFKKPAE